jgi:hypothetical protein
MNMSGMDPQQQQLDIGQLAANLSAQLDELQKELAKLSGGISENNNAFFNCAMALIIFRWFSQGKKGEINAPKFPHYACSDAVRLCLFGGRRRSEQKLHKYYHQKCARFA